MAWGAADPAVVVQTVDFANDGRFFIARKVTSLGGGNWHYELAVQNLNSDRSARGLTVACRKTSPAARHQRFDTDRWRNGCPRGCRRERST